MLAEALDYYYWIETAEPFWRFTGWHQQEKKTTRLQKVLVMSPQCGSPIELNREQYFPLPPSNEPRSTGACGCLEALDGGSVPLLATVLSAAADVLPVGSSWYSEQAGAHGSDGRAEEGPEEAASWSFTHSNDFSMKFEFSTQAL